MQRKILSPGTVIFSEGEPGDCAYVVERGLIEITGIKQNEKITLALLGPGEIFGEMALIDDQLRSATATVAREAEIIVIHREQIIKRLQETEPVIVLLMKTLISRFRAAQKTFLGNTDAGDNDSLLGLSSLDDVADHLNVLDALKREQELKQGLLKGELEPFFQPIVSLRDGVGSGFEALVRWRHPQRGLVPPAEFIALAEKCGLIREIDLFVLQASLGALEEARSKMKGRGDAEPLFVSVNLSGHHFEDDTVINRVRQVLNASNVDPAWVKLEITESALIADPDSAFGILAQLKALGVSIALDDFGTGFSSLSYLQRFPLDVLKIDRSFTKTVTENTRSRAIVQTITQLAKTMEMQVVAEGVEQIEIVDALTKIGCDYAQGHYYGKPMPRPAMLDLVERQAHSAPLLRDRALRAVGRA
jgi:diguanylate cyclase